jgi:hypothetical protein
MVHQIIGQYGINPIRIIQTKFLCQITLKLSLFLEMTFCTYKRISTTAHGELHRPFIVKREVKEYTVKFTLLLRKY